MKTPFFSPSLILGLLLLIATSTTCEAPIEMDLTVASVELSPGNYVVVKIKNTGQIQVPYNKGNLKIYVDRRLEHEIGLGEMTDFGFLLPGSTGTYTSPVKLSGEHRNVLAVLDTENEIEEFSELHNNRSRSLSASYINSNYSNDLSITGIDPYSEQKKVIVTIRNWTIDTLKSVPVRFRLRVNGQQVSQPVLPVSIPNHSSIEVPLGMVSRTFDGVLKQGDHLEASIAFEDPAMQEADNDNVNDRHEEIYFSGTGSGWFQPYQNLLDTEKISKAIQWRDKIFIDGNVPSLYYQWKDPYNQAYLKEAILDLERGRTIGPAAAPVLKIGGRIHWDDAWSLYIAYVAHALWMEVHGNLDWSLLDYDHETLKMLLSFDSILKFDLVTEDNSFFDLLQGADYTFSDLVGVAQWSPQAAYQFMKEMQIIDPENPKKTVYNLTTWMNSHMRHKSVSDGNNLTLYGYGPNAPPPIDRLLYPPLGQDHVSLGCYTASSFYKAMLRSVNIPVVVDSIALVAQDNPEGGMHRRPVLPTLDMGMPHGDDAYSSFFRPSGNMVPVSKLFYPLDYLENRFVNPAELECNESGECHTPAQQASYNNYRDQVMASILYLGDHFLYTYVTLGQTYLEERLIAPFHPGGESPFLLPVLSEEERTDAITLIKAKIDILGEGNPKKAEEILTERFKNYSAYIVDN